jgi:hypothetical protein
MVTAAVEPPEIDGNGVFQSRTFVQGVFATTTAAAPTPAQAIEPVGEAALPRALQDNDQ